jgi:transitional endoplasmic reticulum ATPase
MADGGVQDLLQALMKAGESVKADSAYDRADVQVERSGKKIILPGEPAPMSIPKAIDRLEQVMKDEDQVYALQEVIDAHPLDGLVALNKAMKEIYGWTSPVATPTFFGPKPPEMKSVQTGPELSDVIQVPYGSFKLPGVDNLVQVQIGPYKNRFACYIMAKARRQERDFLMAVAKRAREIVREESIYRGKAISAKVEDSQLSQELTFFATKGVKKEDIILNQDVYDQIQVNLWAPVEKTQMCRNHRVPLKRGVLLEGTYGTGKSLTALVTAKVCQDNGWTFLHIDSVQGLAAALVFAEQYAPCVVFAEDIDRVLTERDDAADHICTTLDGVLSKKAEVITVLTTNHVETIHPVMLRPGRLDAIISITAPDADTCERLIRLYGAGLIDPTTDLSDVSNTLASGKQIPATIREVVERSKLAMISAGETSVTGRALQVTALGMTAHLDLLNKPKNELTDAEKLYNAFGKLVEDAANGETGSIGHDAIYNNIDAEGNDTRNFVQRRLVESEERVQHTLNQTNENMSNLQREVATKLLEVTRTLKRIAA